MNTPRYSHCKMLLNGFIYLFAAVLLVACVSETKKSINNPRKHSELYVEMGVRYMEFGKLNVALEKLERALDIDDSNVNAHNSIAVFYERIRNYSDAEDHFEEALSLEPENPTVLNNFGSFLCKQGETEQAMVYLIKSTQLPLNERPWFAFSNAGKCVFKQGKQELAERYYRQALQHNPSYVPALLGMAEISYEQAKFFKSRAFLERFLSYRKATPEVLILGFLVEQAMGQENKANEYKSQLLNRFPLSEQAEKVTQMQAILSEQNPEPESVQMSEPVLDDSADELEPDVELIPEKKLRKKSSASMSTLK